MLLPGELELFAGERKATFEAELVNDTWRLIRRAGRADAAQDETHGATQTALLRGVEGPSRCRAAAALTHA
jgi:hypothetical protein